MRTASLPAYPPTPRIIEITLRCLNLAQMRVKSQEKGDFGYNSWV